jgi:hypothetical protein
VLVSIFVTLASRIYKGDQGPLSKRGSLGHSTPKAIQITTQDVGCYASCGPNLSKLCVPCTFEFLISASPHPKLTTLGISLGGQPVKHRQLYHCLVHQNIISVQLWLLDQDQAKNSYILQARNMARCLKSWPT